MQGSASGGNQPRTVADEDWMYNPDNFGSTVRKVLTLKPRARAFFVYVVLHLLRPLFFIIQTVLLLVEAGRGTYRVRLTLPAVPHAWVVSAAVAHDTSDRGNVRSRWRLCRSCYWLPCWQPRCACIDLREGATAAGFNAVSARAWHIPYKDSRC